MDSFRPKVAEHATEEMPVIENFLYLFFSPSETSQAAGRAFWERRHARADQTSPLRWRPWVLRQRPLLRRRGLLAGLTADASRGTPKMRLTPSFSKAATSKLEPLGTPFILACEKPTLHRIAESTLNLSLTLQISIFARVGHDKRCGKADRNYSGNVPSEPGLTAR
jgi:hypothetical protein